MGVDIAPKATDKGDPLLVDCLSVEEFMARSALTRATLYRMFKEGMPNFLYAGHRYVEVGPAREWLRTRRRIDKSAVLTEPRPRGRPRKKRDADS